MLCPRCNSEKVRKMVDSPVGNVWSVQVCENCWYSWRSTETPKILPKFQLDDDKIAKMGIIPPIPPLKKA